MTEDQLEQEVLAWLADVGWQHRHGPELAPESHGVACFRPAGAPGSPSGTFATCWSHPHR